MAIFVKTLAATEIIWTQRTIGHISSGKIHVLNTASAKVNGIQNNAIKRSAIARLIRNGRKSVRDRFPFLNTMTTRIFPIIDNVVVNEYKISSTVSVDSSNFGSKNSLFWKDTFLEIFPAISANMMLCGWFKHLCLMSKLTKVHWSKQTICVILKHYNINYFSRI